MARGATLKLADLQKNGAATPEAIYELIYKGKGKMPGYGINCAPKVLSQPMHFLLCVQLQDSLTAQQRRVSVHLPLEYPMTRSNS